jgi:hypothetical protein
MSGQSADGCVLCGHPSSRAGEHVRPRWLMGMFPEAEGPYTWYVNADPIPRRDGRPRRHSSVGATTVPMCEQCNAALNDRFETPVKPLIRQIFETDGRVQLSGSEALIAGRWFVKTWLLLAHPSAGHSEPGIPRSDLASASST